MVNVDPVAQELLYLRKQVSLLQTILQKYKKGIDILKEDVLPEEQKKKADRVSIDSLFY